MSLPIVNGGSFHSAVNVYQAASRINDHNAKRLDKYIQDKTYWKIVDLPLKHGDVLYVM